MGAPTVTSVDLVTSGGTAHIDVDTWELLIRCRLSATQLTLPAGRWRGRVLIASTRPDVAAPTMISEVDATIASPGTVTIPAGTWRTHRPLSGASGAIYARILVERWTGSEFAPYQSITKTNVASVAVAPPAQAKRWGTHLLPYFGLSYRTTEDHTWALDALDTAGADTIRTGLSWSEAQPTEGVWDETVAGKVDSLFTACAARGISVILQLAVDVPPAYAGTAGNPNLTKLATYLDAVLTRWPDVWGVETTNEPEVRGITASQLAACHDVLWTRVQAFNTAQSKSIKVALGAFAFANRDYLDSVLDVGVSGFDAVSHHPYNIAFDPNPDTWGDPARPWADSTSTNEDTENALVVGVYEIDEELRAHGFTDKEQWITEYGFSNAVRDSVPARRLTEVQAARYLATGMRQAARIPMVEVLCAQSLIDNTPSITDWSKCFGLLTQGRREKAQYDSFAEVIAE